MIDLDKTPLALNPQDPDIRAIASDAWHIGRAYRFGRLIDQGHRAESAARIRQTFCRAQPWHGLFDLSIHTRTHGGRTVWPCPPTRLILAVPYGLCVRATADPRLVLTGVLVRLAMAGIQRGDTVSLTRVTTAINTARETARIQDAIPTQIRRVA